MKLKSPYLVPHNSKVRLSRVSTTETGPYRSEDEAATDLERHRHALDRLQEKLTADGRHAVLVVLQGMDTAGKDGTIRHIFTGVNPQACSVQSFKAPTPLEQEHDFLWRVHRAVPAKGMIGIFNRSHYEDVLVPRVHKEITDKAAHRRMDEIVGFEETLVRNGVTVLKFFLHISREEQARRLNERIADPEMQWKLSEADFAERPFWPAYQKAYEDALRRTSRKHAPWFVIPADHKWYRNVAISAVLVEAMKRLKLNFPAASFDARKIEL